MAKGTREKLNTWMDQALNHLRGAIEDLGNMAAEYGEVHPEHATMCKVAIEGLETIATMLVQFQQTSM